MTHHTLHFPGARLLSIHKALMSRAVHVAVLPSWMSARGTSRRSIQLSHCAPPVGVWGRAARWAGLPPGPGCLACPWAAAHPHNNFARNSPVIISNIEIAPLELQRFRVVSKNDRGKLRAKFVWVFLLPSTGTAAGPRYPLAPQPGPPGPPTSSTPVGPGR